MEQGVGRDRRILRVPYSLLPSLEMVQDAPLIHEPRFRAPDGSHALLAGWRFSLDQGIVP
jgi:hypothetical protein